MPDGATRIVWAPQAGPQKALIDCPVPEIFYGGARGGGKTDGVLGKLMLKALRFGTAFNALFFRKELPMLDDAIERSHQIFGPLGATWNEQKKTWRMPGGGRLRFRPLERVADAEKYQGQNVTDCAVEEAGNYPDPAPIDRLNGILRSAAGVPTQLLLTGNPGGPGQQWIRARYVDPAPLGMRILTRPLPSGRNHSYVFIPSRLRNNLILTARDPGYIDRLHLVGSAELVRAWLEGDWSAIAGAYFDCWRQAVHVVPPQPLPAHWTRFRALDWGSARPFSVGWYAVSDGEMTEFPPGALIRYREWYGCTGTPNEGLKLTAEQVATGIRDRTPADERIIYSVGDPSIGKQDGGPSFAERMQRAAGIVWRLGDNQRVTGWDQVRQRLIGEDGKPRLFVFSTCVNLIRTLPALQHDDLKPEDLDSDGEDHAADELRYACMSRPWTAPIPASRKPIDAPPTLDDLWRHQAQRPGSAGRI